MSEILSGLSLLVGVVTLILVLKIYLNNKESSMFADDLKTALTAQTTAITAAQGRAAAAIVSPADQASILGTIQSNTAAVGQIAPATTPQP